jgi:dTDP-4-dehydrorhamnose 3,5-epimerase
MEFKERNLAGVYEITFKPFLDERGFFMRTFDGQLFEKAGLSFHWVQENHSRTLRKTTIRGMHFQFPPYAETKLVRCIRGAVLDVFVDLRKGSWTFGQWDSLLLTEDNNKAVLIPRGFAHGFCTLCSVSEVVYKVDNYYSPGNEGGIIWNDSDLNIHWNCVNPFLSDKDSKNLTMKLFIEKFKALEP